MNKLARAFLLILLVGSLGYAQAAKQAESRVQTIQFESKLVGKTLPYVVVLPTDYDLLSTETKRYPVLYLLHGLNGHYDNWTKHTKLVKYAEQYAMIIVMPEGNNGWYTDSATVPKDKYETYIIDELIPDVQRRYRTIETRAGRGIAGLSMGGYGALKFGVKYPTMFAFAGSTSGAIDAALWTESDLRGLESLQRSLVKVFGDMNNSARTPNDLPWLYRDFPTDHRRELPYLYIDCGTEDPLLSANRSFVDILVIRKIPHEYRQLPGGHTWPYWDAQVQEVLKVAARKMQPK